MSRGYAFSSASLSPTHSPSPRASSHVRSRRLLIERGHRQTARPYRVVGRRGTADSLAEQQHGPLHAHTYGGADGAAPPSVSSGAVHPQEAQSPRALPELLCVDLGGAPEPGLRHGLLSSPVGAGCALAMMMGVKRYYQMAFSPLLFEPAAPRLEDAAHRLLPPLRPAACPALGRTAAVSRHLRLRDSPAGECARGSLRTRERRHAVLRAEPASLRLARGCRALPGRLRRPPGHLRGGRRVAWRNRLGGRKGWSPCSGFSWSMMTRP